jgi:dipeptidyl aminopeptidase/acylaminoacyl peptidase
MGLISLAGDGRRIAYQANISTLNLQRVSFDAESELIGEPIAITSGSRRVRDPGPSPDREWVAFNSDPGGGQADLGVIRADGTGLRQLTDEPHLSHWMPRWSPDGSQIVFYSMRSGNNQLWSTRPDGSGLRQLTQAAYWIQHFAWSPDGKRIVHYSTDGDSYIFQPDVPWKEQNPEKLPRPQEGRFMANSWSPDGERLAGRVEYETGRLPIAVFSLASREYEVFPVAGNGPVWLRDNRRLLFVDAEKIFLLDAMAGRFHEVVSLQPEAILSPFALSSDDRTIYFTRARREADIWMVTLGENPP